MGNQGRRKISQEAFDAAVRENVDEFGMEEEEARADAVQTFKLQGVDLSGIVTDGRKGKHPVVEALNIIRECIPGPEDELGEALTKLKLLLCSDDGGGAENAAVAARNGGIEMALASCKASLGKSGSSLLYLLRTALETLGPLLRDEPSQRDFDSCGGPEILVAAVDVDDSSGMIQKFAGEAVAASTAGNEILKERYMQLKLEEILVRLIRQHRRDAEALEGLSAALRSLVTADDRRVLASNTFRNARRAANAGAVDALLEGSNLAAVENQTLLPLLFATLKCVAANDEICKSVAASGGIDLVLQSMVASTRSGNISLATSSCSLLAQLAGNDASKDAIVMGGGCEKLVGLATCYGDEVAVLQEVMAALACLALRSPVNASKAAEVGAIDAAAEVMRRHPSAGGLHKQACQMLRNLAVRNPENRPLILEKGLEGLIRLAKSKHPSCKDAASAALRDLGLDNYNT